MVRLSANTIVTWLAVIRLVRKTCSLAITTRFRFSIMALKPMSVIFLCGYSIFRIILITILVKIGAVYVVLQPIYSQCQCLSATVSFLVLLLEVPNTLIFSNPRHMVLCAFLNLKQSCFWDWLIKDHVVPNVKVTEFDDVHMISH